MLDRDHAPNQPKNQKLKVYKNKHSHNRPVDIKTSSVSAHAYRYPALQHKRQTTDDGPAVMVDHIKKTQLQEEKCVPKDP
jgi:hypothetical protein